MNILKSLRRGIGTVINSTINGIIIYNDIKILGNISQREVTFQREDGGYKHKVELAFITKDYFDFKCGSIFKYNNIDFEINHVSKYNSHMKIIAYESDYQ